MFLVITLKISLRLTDFKFLIVVLTSGKCNSTIKWLTLKAYSNELSYYYHLSKFNNNNKVTYFIILL